MGETNMTHTIMKARVLARGFAMVESPRWHAGRLWFPHWGTPQIIAADLDGNTEVMAEGRSGLGHSIGWLPDGRMLETGDELTRYEADGSTSVHADLRQISEYLWSEMTIDGRGNIYVNSIGFDFREMLERARDPSKSATGVIALITPDGTARQVADAIGFPNGMVITADNKTLIVAESFTGKLLAYDIDSDGSLKNRRVWAEGIAPDGICLDAEGAIWTGTRSNECVRVAQGGAILDRIQLDRACFATMLGGPGRRTLFIMANDFLGPDKFDEMLQNRSGQVLVADAPAPGAGWP
jgi:sugar lactone lactonase YvrE